MLQQLVRQAPLFSVFVAQRSTGHQQKDPGSLFLMGLCHRGDTRQRSRTLISVPLVTGRRRRCCFAPLCLVSWRRKGVAVPGAACPKPWSLCRSYQMSYGNSVFLRHICWHLWLRTCLKSVASVSIRGGQWLLFRRRAIKKKSNPWWFAFPALRSVPGDLSGFVRF